MKVSYSVWPEVEVTATSVWPGSSAQNRDVPCTTVEVRPCGLYSLQARHYIFPLTIYTDL